MAPAFRLPRKTCRCLSREVTNQKHPSVGVFLICDPRRPTYRTLDFAEVIERISTIHDIFHKHKDPEPVPIALPGVPQWKYNLRNQR
jgi:hypothetical protein